MGSYMRVWNRDDAPIGKREKYHFSFLMCTDVVTAIFLSVMV